MPNYQICEKILNDDSFIKNELDKISIYYNLKHTIRWAKNRDLDITESVAEHVYGMHILYSYFIELVDAGKKLDRELMGNMITWHDMAEAIVSDMTTKSKTNKHKADEKTAEIDIINKSTLHLKSTLETIFSTYEERTTPEAKFVKALDKIEPMFHLYFLKAKGIDIPANFSIEWEANEYREHRNNYVRDFTIIKRFDDILFSETEEYFMKNEKTVD